MGGKLSKQVTALELKAQINAGLTVKAAAEKYQVTPGTIRNYLQYHKVKLRDAQNAVRRVAEPNRIYTIRNERGITQKELSEILGITRQSVANHETSKRKITAVMKIKYAEALDTTVEQLFDDVNDSEEA